VLPRILGIAAIALLGLALALQGWRSRMLTFDLVPYADEATALLAAERLPEKVR
jgi:hypothetical protein